MCWNKREGKEKESSLGGDDGWDQTSKLDRLNAVIHLFILSFIVGFESHRQFYWERIPKAKCKDRFVSSNRVHQMLVGLPG